MDKYRAYFREYRALKTINLILVVVGRVAVRNGGLVAYAKDLEGIHEYKFWLSKKDQPLGARCQVFLRGGDPYPTISRGKSDFSVKTGTVVLLARPHKGSSAFPVVSWDQYQEAMGKSGPMATDPAVAKKGDHRWVEAPPLPKAPNRTPPQD